MGRDCASLLVVKDVSGSPCEYLEYPKPAVQHQLDQEFLI